MPYKNPEDASTYKKQWQQDNPKKIKGYSLNYYGTHRGQVIERAKKYNKDHAEERLLYTQQYRIKNPAKVKTWKKADYARRPGEDNKRRRARKAGATIRDLTAAQWREIKEAYAHRCVYCGRKMKRLTQDHLTPLSKQGNHTVMNVVPACQSCNSHKYNNGVPGPVQPLLLTIAPAKKKA